MNSFAQQLSAALEQYLSQSQNGSQLELDIQPVRDLLPNEKFQTGLMGVGIIRTDLQQTQAEAAGQFTPDDRATLKQIYQIVSRLGL